MPLLKQSQPIKLTIVSSPATSSKYNDIKYDIFEIILQTLESTEFGFTIAGYCPCYIEKIQEKSIAAKAGLREKDLIMKINNVNCCRATLKTTLNLMKQNTTGQIMLQVYRLKQQLINKQPKSAHLDEIKRDKKPKLFSKLSSWMKFQSCSSTTNSTTQYNNSTSFYMPSSSIDIKQSTTTLNCGDTGYDSMSRQYSSDLPTETNDFTIDTVTNTTNSYSDCDLTVEPLKQLKPIQRQQEKLNESKIKLIGNLIKLEDNFVCYLNNAVSTLVRPLRGFFMKQQDYFLLFQNIEKILVISENFLRSMDKWSAYELYTRIGQLYTQKLSLFRDAFTSYCKGYSKSKSLFNELKSHSKQFRLFLKETQTKNLKLDSLLDLPIVYLNETLNIFKEIRSFTFESKRSPSEAPHIDSVIFE